MKENKFRILFILIVLVIIGFAIFKIYGKNTQEISENELHYEKVTMITSLRLGIAEYDSINPLISKNKEIINMSPIIYEPLFTLDKQYQIQDCLAKEYSKLNNYCYIIKIRDNVKWQDNTNFTLEDVIFTIDKIKQLPNSIYYNNVSNIKNVEKIDYNTLRLNLSAEDPWFQFKLTFPILSNTQYKTQDFLKTIPIGTGMYKITKDNENNIEAEKNNSWWNIEIKNAKIEKLKIYKYSSVGDLYNNFKLGNIDLINTSNTNIQEYVGTIGINLKEYQGREYIYLALNCDNKILANKEVRQAMSYFIDKDTLVSKVLNNKYNVSDFILDYGSYLYKEEKRNSYNAKKAKEILEATGWKLNYGKWQKDGKYIELNLAVNSEDETRVKIAESIKEQLEDAGIKIYINKVSLSTYNSYLKNKDYDIILTGMYNSYSPDLNTLYAENNLANYKNEEIFETLTNINNTTDRTILKEKYNRLIEISQEDVPYIGLCRNKNTMVCSPNLIGEISPNNYTCYYNIDTWYRQ